MKKQYTAPSIKMRAFESETGILSASGSTGPTNLNNAPDFGGDTYDNTISAGSKGSLWDEE